MIASQSLQKREYWQSPSLFTPLTCLDMETVPLSECCEYTNPCNIAKSVLHLPKIGEGLFGLAIQAVYSSDRKKKITPITPNSYIDILKLNIPKKVYFWVMNNHLYVTNPDTRLVDMFAYCTEIPPNELLYPGKNCDCKTPPSVATLCTNPLDNNFYFIDKRMDDLKQQVYKKLLSTYFNVAAEYNKTSDNREESSK